jgi:hypothetical protein
MRRPDRRRLSRSRPESHPRGLWSNEFVPSYQCPDSHDYLEDRNYAPAGTALINSVEVKGLGPIGVSITGTRGSVGILGIIDNYAIGSLTGLPDSSATNWKGGNQNYCQQESGDQRAPDVWIRVDVEAILDPATAVDRRAKPSATWSDTIIDAKASRR